MYGLCRSPVRLPRTRRRHARQHVRQEFSADLSDRIAVTRSPALKARLERFGPVLANDFLLKCSLDSYELTVFPDGRVIVKGTQDPAIARVCMPAISGDNPAEGNRCGAAVCLFQRWSDIGGPDLNMDEVLLPPQFQRRGAFQRSSRCAHPPARMLLNTVKAVRRPENRVSRVSLLRSVDVIDFVTPGLAKPSKSSWVAECLVKRT